MRVDLVRMENGLAASARTPTMPWVRWYLPFGSLVRVGVGAHGDGVAPPPRRRQLGPEPLDGVHLHDDLALEVGADVEPEVVVGGAGEAVDAGVAAAPIGVDGVPERHAAGRRHRVDDGAAADVEELEAAELTPPDVALDDLLVGEQHALAARPRPCAIAT